MTAHRDDASRIERYDNVADGEFHADSHRTERANGTVSLRHCVAHG